MQCKKVALRKNDALVPEAWELHFIKIWKKNNISLDFNEIYREKRKKLTYKCTFSSGKELKFRLIANTLPTGILYV